MNERVRRLLTRAAGVTAAILFVVSVVWDTFWGDSPFWLVLLILLLSIPLAVIGYRTDRRNKRWKSGLCGYCSYNLTGNASGVCPECGKCVPVTGGTDG